MAADNPVDQAWVSSSYRMEVWMTGATAKSVLFLPDPDLLVCGEADGTIRVLDEQSRGPTSVVAAHKGGVTSIVSARTAEDRNLFVSSGEDCRVLLWKEDAAKPRHFEVISEHRDFVDSQPALDRKVRLLSAGNSSMVIAYGPTETIQILQPIETPGGNTVLHRLFEAKTSSGPAMHLDAEKNALVIVDAKDTVRSWDLASRQMGFEFAAEDGPVTALKVTAGAVLLGLEGGAIDVRELGGGVRRHLIKRHHGKVTHLLSVKDIVISGGEDAEIATGRECIRFCNSRTGRTLGSFTTPPVTCMAMRAFFSDGSTLQQGAPLVVTGHADGKAMLWDVAEQRSIHVLDGHREAVRSVHANRLCAVTGGEDMCCRVWRFADQFVLEKEKEEIEKRKKKAQECSEDAKKAYSARQLKEAVRLYGKAMELEPMEAKHCTNRAAAFFEMGEYAMCKEDCDRVISRLLALKEEDAFNTADAPQYAKAYARKAKAQARLGDSEGAIQNYLESLKLVPAEGVAAELAALRASGEEERNKGNEAFRNKDFASAIAHYSEAIEASDSDARNWGNRAAAYLEAGEAGKCVEDCDAALKCLDKSESGSGSGSGSRSESDQPLRAKLLNRKAKALAQTGDLQGAVASYEESNKVVPSAATEKLKQEAMTALRLKENPTFLIDQAAKDKERGNEMFKARRYQDAIAYYDKAVECDPDNPVYLLNRATALSEQKNFSAAQTDFSNAAKGARRSQETKHLIGRCMAAIRILIKEARMVERKAADERSKEQRAARLREAAQHVAASLKEESLEDADRRALEEVKQSIQRRQDEMKNADFVIEEVANGDRMMADGQYAAAVKYYDKAVAADPQGKVKDAFLMFANRGMCLLEMKRPRQALADAEMCVKVNPGWMLGHVLKGRAHQALEQWTEVLSESVIGYDLAPDNETVLAMMRDCLFQHLTDEKLQKSTFSGMSDAIGKARSDPEVQKLMSDPEIMQVVKAMQVSRDLSPLASKISDLPFCGKFTKLYSTGLLVDGRVFS